MRQSSAYRRHSVPGSNTWGRLFINNKNNNGPNTVPWGTPDTTGSPEVALPVWERIPSTTTFWVQLWRKQDIQAKFLPSVPYKCNLRMSFLYGTESNALEKSKTVMLTVCFLSKRVRESWVVMRSCGSQCLLFTNPCWFEYIRPYISKWEQIWSVMICSNSLRDTRETHRSIVGSFKLSTFLEYGCYPCSSPDIGDNIVIVGLLEQVGENWSELSCQARQQVTRNLVGAQCLAWVYALQ